MEFSVPLRRPGDHEGQLLIGGWSSKHGDSDSEESWNVVEIAWKQHLGRGSSSVIEEMAVFFLSSSACLGGSVFLFVLYCNSSTAIFLIPRFLFFLKNNQMLLYHKRECGRLTSVVD
jgi:hypothetical protein